MPSSPSKDKIKELINQCKQLEQKTSKEEKEINSSFDWFDNFYDEINKYITFKQETCWYEPKSKY